MSLTTRHSASSCPNCLATLDASTHEEGCTPIPGDYSVCAYCSAPLIYAEDLTLRSATVEEVREMVKDEDFVRAVMGVQVMIAAKLNGETAH